MVNLPYNLREGQVAYAAKVMANFRALLGACSNISVNDIGGSGPITADVQTIVDLLVKSMVMADERGNSEHIVFGDGENLEQKFDSGTLNASLLDSEGLFYFEVRQQDGHLYVTASDGMEADNFAIRNSDGHLIFTLNDPADSTTVHTYDLGRVKGDADKVLGYYSTPAALQAAVTSPDPGDRYGVGSAAPYDIYVWDSVSSSWKNTGSGNMSSSVYDPNGVRKDVNTYTAFFNCAVDSGNGEHPCWGAYILTEDTTFSGDKTYYTYDSGEDEYTAATVTTGATVPANTYYEKLDAREYRLDDSSLVSGDHFLSDHITAISGHALIGPAEEANGGDATGAEAWANAGVWVEAQGNGWFLLKALGDIPEDDIVLQVTVFK